MCIKEPVACACFVSVLENHIYVRHSECLKMSHCLRIACCRMMGQLWCRAGCVAASVFTLKKKMYACLCPCSVDTASVFPQLAKLHTQNRALEKEVHDLMGRCQEDKVW